MKRCGSIMLLVFIVSAANIVFAADGDERFRGGNYDGYAQYSVLDTPIMITEGMIIRICRKYMEKHRAMLSFLTLSKNFYGCGKDLTHDLTCSIYTSL